MQLQRLSTEPLIVLRGLGCGNFMLLLLGKEVLIHCLLSITLQTALKGLRKRVSPPIQLLVVVVARSFQLRLFINDIIRMVVVIVVVLNDKLL